MRSIGAGEDGSENEEREVGVLRTRKKKWQIDRRETSGVEGKNDGSETFVCEKETTTLQSTSMP